MGIEDDLEAARVLGLGEPAARGYAMLLAQHGDEPGPAAVDELLSAAYVARTERGIAPVDPDPALSTARHRAVSRTQAARSTVLDAFDRARVPGSQPRVGHVRALSPRQAPAAVRRRLSAEGARPAEVSLVDCLPTEPGWAWRAAGVRTLLAAGVRVRVVYRGDPAESISPAREELAALAAAGARVRVGHGSGTRVVLADHDIAWLWSTGYDDVVELTVPTLLVVTRALFDAAWHAATEVAARGGPAPADLRVLQGLAAGLSDEQAARALRISTRTLARRVTALLAATGCATRFQLATHAVDEGWL